MKAYKFLIYTLFILYSFSSISQVISPALLSQLSPAQIEAITGALGANNPDRFLEEPMPITMDEDLSTDKVNENNSSEIIRLSPNEKYGYSYFSSGFFSSVAKSKFPTGDLPLPNEYKISLRDELSIILSGTRSETFNLRVKLDGSILFPEIGSISVAGKTLEEVQEILTSLVNQSFVGTNVNASIKNLSAKKISIVGAVNSPGTYLVNPLSTITSALEYSKGITEIGSLRKIKLIRINGDIFYFDLYELLINGDRSKDISVEAGDVILIEPADQFVRLSGSIRRPAIYEIIEGEELKDLIKFGLGFQETTPSDITLKMLDRKTRTFINKKVSDLSTDLSDVFSVDVYPSYKRGFYNFYASEVTPANDLINVYVSGAVKSPGTYTLESNTTLDELYRIIGEFKPEAFNDGIIFTRLSIREKQLESLRKFKLDLEAAKKSSSDTGADIGNINIIEALSESIDPKNLGRISGDFSPGSSTSSNIILKEGDSIIIPTKPYTINVFGEVLNPTAFEYSRRISVNQAINTAGGLKSYADKNRIYVIKANGIVKKQSRSNFTKVLTLGIFPRNLKLEPGDTVVVPRRIVTRNNAIQALIPITQIISDLAFAASAIDNLNDN